MRIWLIADVHFGVRSNNVEWMNIQLDYFRNFLIPKIKDHYIEGDILFILGDLFDNRQSINIRVLKESSLVLKDLSDILPVHIIAGNHDLYSRTNNDISSLDIFEDWNNITIYKDPQIFNANDNPILLMPWRKNNKEERECIESFKAADLFCHTDIPDLYYNKYVKIEHGNSRTLYNAFNSVFSGHIHYSQNSQNIVMIGSPYHLNRSDIDNQKRLILYEPGNPDYIEWKNDYSPVFKEYDYYDIDSITLNSFLNSCKNNFIDLHVPEEILAECDLNPIITEVDNVSRSIDIFGYDSSIKKDESDIDIEHGMDIMSLVEKHLKDSSYSKNLKTEIKKSIKDYISKINEA